MQTRLTPKQKQILDWIEAYLRTRKTMPSRREIASGLGLSSPATIQQHIEALEKKGYLKRGEERESRALHWTARARKLFSESSPNSPQKGPMEAPQELPDSIEIPLLGSIAAGNPVEVYPDPELQRVPLHLFPGARALDPSQLFMLTVRGESMIEDGILPGDRVILRRVSQIRPGDTVAALLNGEATLKRWFRTKNRVELHPANPAYPVIPVSDSDRLEIQGVLIGLIRRYS